MDPGDDEGGPRAVPGVDPGTASGADVTTSSLDTHHENIRGFLTELAPTTGYLAESS